MNDTVKHILIGVAVALFFMLTIQGYVAEQEKKHKFYEAVFTDCNYDGDSTEECQEIIQDMIESDREEEEFNRY